MSYASAGKTGLGAFTPEDDNVAKAVAEASSDTSPLIRMARQDGLDSAASRGLGTSSIAAEASQREAYKVALPIGQQQAAQGFQKNKSNQDFEQTNYTADQGNQSQERIASGAQAGETLRAGMSIDDAQKRQSQQLGATQALSDQDSQTKLALQNIQTDAQERIANMNVTSNAQDKAQAAATNASSIYGGMVNAITGNQNIPADARTALLENAKAELASNISLTEQLYNIDLNWSAPATPAATTDSPAGGIVSIYQELLGRDPDQSGLRTFAGMSDDQIRAAVMASPEYRARAGSGGLG